MTAMAEHHGHHRQYTERCASYKKNQQQEYKRTSHFIIEKEAQRGFLRVLQSKPEKHNKQNDPNNAREEFHGGFLTILIAIYHGIEKYNLKLYVKQSREDARIADIMDSEKALDKMSASTFLSQNQSKFFLLRHTDRRVHR